MQTLLDSSEVLFQAPASPDHKLSEKMGLLHDRGPLFGKFSRVALNRTEEYSNTNHRALLSVLEKPTFV